MFKTKKERLWLFGALLALVIVLFVVIKNTASRVILGTVIAALLVAIGLESKNTDYDMGKLIKTGSFAAAKIERDPKTGEITNAEAFCNAKEIDYDCKDFRSQDEAMGIYNKCKTAGKNMDAYGLDRDHDGKVCESLPLGAVAKEAIKQATEAASQVQ